jgi:hypothetical protein
MSRRALTPAARGVSLAVLAALRGGRVDLADQADGSTLATSTAPDGTRLMTCTLWQPVTVRGVDTRTPTLPNVSMIPAAAPEAPAPVAVPAGEVAAPTTVRCWISELQWDDLALRDEESHGWVAEPVAGAELGWECVGTWVQAMVPTGAALTELRKVCTRVGVTLHESDTMPPPHTPQSARVNGLGPGDLIEMDGARATVGGVDHEGFAWCETNAKGYLTGPVERVLWREVEHLGDNRWRILPVETETPSQKAKREKAGKPKRAKAAKAAEVVAPVEAPAVDADAAPLPEGDELVEVVLRECPTSMRGLDVIADGTGRVVLWVFASKTSEELVATVPADLARTLQAKAKTWWSGWRAANKPASVVVIGGEVPTPQGLRKVLGVTLCDESCDGLVLETPDGPQVAWLDNVSLERGVATVQTFPRWELTEGADGTWIAERLPDEPKKPRRAAKAAKARPARLTPEPGADALTRHGQRCVVAMLHAGGPWELVWCDEMPGQMTHDVAWRSVEEQAHRARRYDRGGHCAADTRDTPRQRVEAGGCDE